LFIARAAISSMECGIVSLFVAMFVGLFVNMITVELFKISYHHSH